MANHHQDQRHQWQFDSIIPIAASPFKSDFQYLENSCNGQSIFTSVGTHLVQGVGSIHISSFNGQQDIKMQFRSAFYIPTLPSRLFSEPLARQGGLSIRTDPSSGSVWLCNHLNQAIFTGSAPPNSSQPFKMNIQVIRPNSKRPFSEPHQRSSPKPAVRTSKSQPTRSTPQLEVVEIFIPKESAPADHNSEQVTTAESHTAETHLKTEEPTQLTISSAATKSPESDHIHTANTSQSDGTSSASTAASKSSPKSVEAQQPVSPKAVDPAESHPVEPHPATNQSDLSSVEVPLLSSSARDQAVPEHKPNAPIQAPQPALTLPQKRSIVELEDARKSKAKRPHSETSLSAAPSSRSSSTSSDKRPVLDASGRRPRSSHSDSAPAQSAVVSTALQRQSAKPNASKLTGKRSNQKSSSDQRDSQLTSIIVQQSAKLSAALKSAHPPAANHPSQSERNTVFDPGIRPDPANSKR